MQEKSTFDLGGKFAIVTGGGQGLGRAMALALAQAGAGVAIADRNEDTGKATSREIQALGRRSLFVRVDMGKPDEVRAMVEEVARQFGSIDILVNNAGIFRGAAAEELSLEDWDAVYDINVRGVFVCSQAVARVMIKQGKGGKIINVASLNARIINNVGMTAYCSSKSAVASMTRVMAVDWAKYAINVNSISPGYFRTPLTEDIVSRPGEEPCRSWLARTPAGRIGNPPELGGAVVFLASSASGFVTGHDLVVDGGCTIW